MKEIQLTRGFVAIVDDEDYEWLNQWKWSCDSRGYAIRYESITKGKQTAILMHRQILNLLKGDIKNGDHINGNRLDNRKENLRICSKSENNRNRNIGKDNTSGYKGVSWNGSANKWQSRIRINGKQKHLGLFTCPKEAHEAYKKAAMKNHGLFANFGSGCVIS